MIGKLISRYSKQQWFRMDQLLNAALADVISADAHFQLSQAKAWRDFGHSLAEFSQVPPAEREDLATSLSRLENLGLVEVSITLPLEAYKPNLFLRVWLWFRKVFGSQLPDTVDQFRLTKPDRQQDLEVCIKVQRGERGKWEVSTSQQTSDSLNNSTPMTAA
ncbi:hypothetical protein BTA51_02415 [Hahella sp. CCB-MM4]|uniref:hypothetical protein n=1 Tax=Hahella sp. (strain CCB-MM4) TaxID=1926491 RepID=UPI000B9B56A7|nr:hypothetical protein [Hahella sp. CCB-MM4]OZG75258.1 hypothetical protein BTA51_02415 [Hahella sp. CCB-MM4]